MLAEWALQRGIRFAYASSAATYGALEGRLVGDRGHQIAAAAQHVRLLEAAIRPARIDARLSEPDRRAEVLQRVRAERRSQGRHAERRNKAFRQITDERARAALQELSSGVRGWRAAAGFSLRQGRGRDDAAPRRPPSANGLYNIGSGESHTWRELVEWRLSGPERPIHIEFIEMPVELRAKYQYSTEASIDRLRGTGYLPPITPLADAVHDYVTRYLVPNRHLGDEGRAEPALERPAERRRNTEVAFLLARRRPAIEALEAVHAPVQIADDITLETGIELESHARAAVERVVRVGRGGQVGRAPIEREPGI